MADLRRALSPDALRSRVLDVIAKEGSVPDGARGAVIAVVNLDQVQLALALNAGDGWTVDLLASYAWDGNKTLEATVTKVW